jgi:hypothetical protein
MRCASSIDEVEEILGIAKNRIIFPFFYRLNAAVQRPRASLSSATHVHNEMAHVRRARADVSRGSSLEKVDTRWLVAAALKLHRRTVSERRV